MRNKIFYLLLLSLVFCFIACDENEDGFYNNVPRIYFPEETDSLNYSFGDKLAEYTRHTVLVPVRMIGMKATREMNFKVVFDKEQSTAQEGVQFEKLQAEYPLFVDSVNAYIPVVLCRENMSEDEVIYKIVLRVEANSDFELGSKENLSAVLTFNNYLEEPEWWMNVFGGYVPYYNRAMYQRLIAYYGHPLEQDYCFEHYLEVLGAFKQEVYDYWKEHPELDWEFLPEETLWWPYN